MISRVKFIGYQDAAVSDYRNLCRRLSHFSSLQHCGLWTPTRVPIGEKQMRWFKHFTDASDDVFLAQLYQKWGHAGTDVWWRILELVADQGCPQGNTWRLVGVSWTTLRQKAKTSRRLLGQMLEFWRTNGKVFLENVGEKVNIEWPKLLELKDHYTRDLLASAKSLPSNSHIEAEVEGEVEGKAKEYKKDHSHSNNILSYQEYTHAPNTNSPASHKLGWEFMNRVSRASKQFEVEHEIQVALDGQRITEKSFMNKLKNHDTEDKSMSIKQFLFKYFPQDIKPRRKSVREQMRDIASAKEAGK